MDKMRKKISITIQEKILGDIDSIIDNIYIRNRSQAIEHLVKNALGENKVAVILAGGDEHKLRINGYYRITAFVGKNRVVELAINKLRSNGFKTIFLVARHNVLTKVFEILKDGSPYGVKINYVEEKNSRGTADSLRLLKGKIKGNFLAVYGDIIFDKIKIDELWNDHIRQNALATIMLTTSDRPSEKGTCKVEGNKVLQFTQKPKKSDTYLVFSPLFASASEIFEYPGNSLESDVFPQLADKGLLNGHLSSEKERHIHGKEDLN